MEGGRAIAQLFGRHTRRDARVTCSPGSVEVVALFEIRVERRSIVATARSEAGRPRGGKRRQCTGLGWRRDGPVYQQGAAHRARGGQQQLEPRFGGHRPAVVDVLAVVARTRDARIRAREQPHGDGDQDGRRDVGQQFAVQNSIQIGHLLYFFLYLYQFWRGVGMPPPLLRDLLDFLAGFEVGALQLFQPVLDEDVVVAKRAVLFAFLDAFL